MALAAPRQAAQWQFNDVQQRFFGQTQDAGNSSFQFEATGSSFSVAGVSTAGRPAQGLSLFAALVGPQLQHYACFMTPAADGTHSCPHTQYLAAGAWNVSVVLMRHYTANVSERCTLAGAGRGPLVLRWYILQKNFSTFDEYRECFGYPHSSAVNFTWHKTAPALLAGGADSAGGADRQADRQTCKRAGRRVGRYAG